MPRGYRDSDAPICRSYQITSVWFGAGGLLPGGLKSAGQMAGGHAMGARAQELIPLPGRPISRP
ncbi:protein of unknown function [Burkholderia multivorans]